MFSTFVKSNITCEQVELIQFSNKMASYRVRIRRVRLSAEAEEEAKIRFTSMDNLKVLAVDFEHRTSIHFYMKNVSLAQFDAPLNDTITMIVLGNDLTCYKREYYQFRFESKTDRDHFLQSGFTDR